MRIGKGKLVLSVLLSVLIYGLAHATEPAAVWVSIPAKPGEAVMIYGGPWDAGSKVELSGPDKRTVSPLKVTDDCLTFIYPSDWPDSAFTAKIVDGKSAGVEVRINAPDIWWIQGDAGKSASPGGWLRVFGRCIGYNKNAHIELNGSGKTFKIPSTTCDLFTLSANIPKDLPQGEYEVFVSNGLDKNPAAAGKIKIAPFKEPWPEKIFNIIAYGAIANDGNDDSRAIRAALADIAKNGGGILQFPRGRFQMQGTIELPPNTLLRGEDMTLTEIYWLDEDYPKGALISGKYNFGIENVFLLAANIDTGIISIAPQKADKWKNENILIRRIRTRFMHDVAGKEEQLRRIQSGGTPFGISGEFVRVIDCDFYFSKNASHLGGKYLLVIGNRFDGAAGCGYIGGQNVIFENNNHEYRGMSFGNGSRCFYLKNNKIGGLYGDGDRETLTFDGGNFAYGDTVVSSSGRNIELKPFAWRHGADSWLGEPIYIADGKGAGQIRSITKIDGNKIEIDKSWDIQPDQDSFFVIAPVRSKLLFLDNQVRDGNTFAMYGSAVDIVVAGNMIQRTGGIHAHGMDKGAPEPSWFVQFLDNQILEGNSPRGPFSFCVPPTDAWLGYFDRGVRGKRKFPENRVGIMRRNILHSNSYLYSNGRVKNLLMENNLVKNSDNGVIAESPDVKDAVIRGNRFENVIRPYKINDQAMISPADRLIAGLAAAECSLKAYLPADWKKYVAEAEALSKKSVTEAECAKSASEILLRAVKALSAKAADHPIPSETVAALFGIDLSQRTPWLLSKIGDSKEALKNATVEIGSAYPAWSLPATLTAKTEGFKEWKVSVDSPVKLLPGKTASCKLHFDKPACPPSPFTLPVNFEIAGDGWKFKFSDNYVYERLDVDDFLVAGPFKNSSGKNIDTDVHPPEIRLDVSQTYDTLDGRRTWLPVKADTKGKVDLCTVLKNTEMSTAHAVAVVRASKPLQVKVAFTPKQSTLAFVNGERTGSSAGRDAPRCVNLKKGDNLFQLISSHGSGEWPITLTLTTVDPTEPGDLQVLSADELPKSPLLTSQDGKIPEGKSLPNSMGVDWKLIHSDNFNRYRIGDEWKGLAVHYMSQKLSISDGAMTPEASMAFMLYDKKIKLPVRIEFDVFAGGDKRNMTGVQLSPSGLAMRTFWHKLVGRGYYLSLGWHDAKNNRVIRDTETVLLDTKGLQLETGKWYHVTAQFVPPHCQIYVDGALVMDYKDPNFLPGLDQIGLHSIPQQKFDNVRIYEQK